MSGPRAESTEALVAKLAGALAGSRVVSIVGPSRAGKSRLVRHWMRFAERSSSQLRAVSLAEARTIEGVLATMAIGLSRSIPGSGLDGFADAVGGAPSHWVILGAGYASVWLRAAIPIWLSRAPALRLVLTSTAALRIPDEHVVELDSFNGVHEMAPSWDELGEDERSLLAIASMLASPVPIAVIETLLEWRHPRVLDAVEQLASSELVALTGARIRVRSLGRALGRQMIETGVWRAPADLFRRVDDFRIVQAEQAATHVVWPESHASEGEPQAPPFLASVVDSLAIASRYSSYMDPGVDARGAIALLELLSLLGAPPLAVRARALARVSVIEERTLLKRACSNIAQSPDASEDALDELAEALGPEELLVIATGGSCLCGLITAYVAADRADLAVNLAETARAIAELRGDRRREGLALACLGMALVDRDELRQGLACYQRALVLVGARDGDRTSAAIIMALVASAEASLGFLREARFDIESAKKLGGEPSDMVRALEALVSSFGDSRGNERVRPPDAGSNDPLLAVIDRWLDRRACAAKVSVAQSHAEERVLLVGPDAHWLDVRNGSASKRIDLGTHPSLRRISQALCRQHLELPGVGLSQDALFRAGWPSDRASVEAARGRVYTAVRTLRRLGLSQWLVRRDGGYLLDTSVTVVVG